MKRDYHIVMWCNGLSQREPWKPLGKWRFPQYLPVTIPLVTLGSLDSWRLIEKPYKTKQNEHVRVIIRCQWWRLLRCDQLGLGNSSSIFINQFHHFIYINWQKEQAGMKTTGYWNTRDGITIIRVRKRLPWGKTAGNGILKQANPRTVPHWCTEHSCVSAPTSAIRWNSGRLCEPIWRPELTPHPPFKINPKRK